jgi:acylphosphatase
VIIRGRVQGVFFRATCAREATLRDVRGWVRNTADGSVEALFEGDFGAVEAMTAWCRHGPPGARVDALEVHVEAPEGLRGFAITG